jgi:hypothetical protein
MHGIQIHWPAERATVDRLREESAARDPANLAFVVIGPTGVNSSDLPGNARIFNCPDHDTAENIAAAIAGTYPTREGAPVSPPDPDPETAPLPETIQSFCTVATERFANEAEALVYSLRQWHDEPIVVLCDAAVRARLEGKRDNLILIPSAHPRRMAAMHRQWFAGGIREAAWPTKGGYPNCPEACMLKMDALEIALQIADSTLFLDADFLILRKIDDPLPARLGFTPHWHRPDWDVRDQYGRHNAGMVYCADPAFPDWWRDAALNASNFMDQQCLDNAPGDPFEFGPAHNFGFWRLYNDKRTFHKGEQDPAKVCPAVGLRAGSKGVTFQGDPLASFHVQISQTTPGHANLQRCVRHLLKKSRIKEHKQLLRLLSKK